MVKQLNWTFKEKCLQGTPGQRIARREACECGQGLGNLGSLEVTEE